MNHAFVNQADLGLVQAARHLLSIMDDEGPRCPFSKRETVTATEFSGIEVS